MTLVPLDELLEGKPLLTVPEHPAAELGRQYGYYEDTVNGRRHYVTKDDRDRAVVGPKRHRAKGLLGLGRKRRAPEPAEATVTMAEYGTQVHAYMEMALAEAGVVLQDVPTISFEVPTPSAPQKRPSMVRRLRNAVSKKFWDTGWHEAMQNTAKTTLYWGFVAASFIVFAKGILWVVTL